MKGAVAVVALVGLAGCGGAGGGAAQCSNCAGCCLNGVCQPGIAAGGCGKGGGACVVCAANQICRVDQTCGVDPESTWAFQPTRAQIAPSNNGANWDGDGSPPDPKVSMTCPGASGTTSTTPFVQNPADYVATWSTGGCTAKAKDFLAAKVQLQLFDDDTFVDDTITGVLQYQVSAQDFVAGVLAFGQYAGMMSLNVALQKL